MRFSTLSEVLKERRSLTDKGITFIEGNGREQTVAYKELYAISLRVLAFLQDKGIQPGNELVLQIDDNKAFVPVFWACILGGIIPVPLAIGRNDGHRQKLFSVWALLNNPFLIGTGDDLDTWSAFAGQKGYEDTYSHMLERMIRVRDVFSSIESGQVYDAKAGDIAFLQFSSGSTGNPKGIVLTHGNLLANMQGISDAAHYIPEDVMLSWMPLTHDMGLIGFHINPLFVGMNQYLMPPQLFIHKPALWMDKATAHHITILSSPNFGYDHFLKYCGNSAGTYSWDLSAVRLIYNGAEPISEELGSTFLAKMSKYGLRSTALCPVYGLAEATLAVSISGLQEEMQSVHVSRDKLRLGDRISQELPSGHTLSFVNVGKAIHCCSVRIVEEGDALLPDDTVGHVQIKGDSVCSGYYNNQEETAKAMAGDGWLRTGDLGFIRNGAIYITGRYKDIIFKNGQNYYPHDVEKLAGELAGIELNKVAVVGFFNPDNQVEEVIAFVVHRGELKTFVPMVVAIKELINSHMGFALDSVIPVKNIPRTTSGKLERYKLLERYKNGDFQEAVLKLDQLMNEPEGTSSDGPEDGVEQAVRRIWQDVLQKGDVRITDQFFEIGGNSLRAAEVAMKVLREFRVDLPIDATYRWRTVKELAAEIISADQSAAYVGIPVAPAAGDYRLSAAQKRLYYFRELYKDSIAYNLPVAFEIKGSIDRGKLQKCLQIQIARHDAWRASFHMAEEPRFSIRDTVDFTLNCMDCSRDLLKEHLQSLVRPFDLSTDPLFRFKLIRLSDDEHVLFADFHHLISDGSSIYYFVEELLQLYAGKQLEAPMVHYRDYSCWEEACALSERIRSQEGYWSDHLRGGLPVLEMALDFPRPARLATEGEKIEFELCPETTMQLRRLADAGGCSLHVLLFTLYNVFLAKYTGQEDLVVGIPVSGRRHPDLARVQGMFVNELAVRSTVNGKDSFFQLVEREKENIAAALRNQEYPFGDLIELLRQQRNPGRNPLFDTMFLYHNMGFPELPDGGLRLSRYFFDPGFSKFDLSLEVFEEKEKLACNVEYSTRLFTRGSASAMVRHFNLLVRKVIAAPNGKLADLHLLDDAGYQAAVRSFNATATELPFGCIIHRLFEEQVKRTPGKIAIAYEQEQISYLELNKRADHLAHLLQRKGVTRESIVAIRIPRSPELIIGILGVLKAGGCYLPIDADLPLERVNYLLADSQCRWLIAESDTCFDDLPAVEIIRIYGPDPEAAETSSPVCINSPHDLAYVIYTSGTTGNPKGVMIEHGSVVNYVNWAAKMYIKDGDGSFALYTSISFDLTVTSVFMPLLTGNRIVLYKEEDKELLIEKVLSDNKAAIVKVTPSHLKLLNARPFFRHGVESLIKVFIVGGEQLESRLAAEVYERFGGKIDIYNEYGPTEATVGCMIHKFEPNQGSSVVPIGLPIANTRVYLLDQHLQPVPPGIKGELYIAGSGIARGYLFNRKLTEEKFIEDPFFNGERMYRSGDIARRLPDGILEYTGRYDQQVKINGYRVEPAEIEGHLVGYRGITAALVIVRTDREGKTNLFAYYVLPAERDKTIPESVLLEHLAARLPHYMIPRRFMRIDGIPLTRNGKADPTALPEMVAAEPVAEPGLPADEITGLCLQTWREVFSRNSIGVLDNFFELGGDSIKAVQIASRLFDKGVTLRSKDILTYHTIEHIGRYAHLTMTGKKYQQGLIEGKKRLSPVESWFFSLELSHPNHYHQSVLLSLNRALRPELLALALKTIVTHHDGLRMNFDPTEGVLFYNNRHLEKEFVIDHLPENIPLIYEWKGRFDITAGLLLRAALIPQAGRAGCLLITAHHLVMDGVSWRILLEDLYTVYNALEKGEPVRLSPKTASLLDYEKALSKIAVSGRSDHYWQSAGRDEFCIPVDTETTNWAVENLHTVTGILNEEKTAFLLGEAHRSYKTDTSMILHVALALTLKKWTGLDTVVVEEEHHGRQLDAIDVSRTIGWFTAMYPLKLRCKDEAIGNQIKAVKEAMENIPNQGIDYGVRKYLGVPGASAGPTRSEIRFNYLGQFGRELNNDLFSYNRRSTGSDVDLRNAMTAKLEFNAMIMYDELTIELRFNLEAHKESTANRVLGIFFEQLERILEHLKKENTLHFTPADFSAVDLDERALNELFR